MPRSIVVRAHCKLIRDESRVNLPRGIVVRACCKLIRDGGRVDLPRGIVVLDGGIAIRDGGIVDLPRGIATRDGGIVDLSLVRFTLQRARVDPGKACLPLAWGGKALEGASQ